MLYLSLHCEWNENKQKRDRVCPPKHSSDPSNLQWNRKLDMQLLTHLVQFDAAKDANLVGRHQV